MLELGSRAGLALALAALAVASPAVSAAGQDDPIVVGSKNFTESRVLGELMALSIEAHTDLAVELRADLGGTAVCFGALRAGEIDVYAEYTGTAWAVVLGETGRIRDSLQTFLEVQARCRERFDVEWLAPFGFDNTYALAMRAERAAELGLERISDLAPLAGQLGAGFSIEFMNRADGWPGLAEHYGLELESARAMEHALAYEALVGGSIDLVDAYATDAKLERYGLRVLADDRDFFPPYDAAPLVRGAALREHPELRAALERLAFRLPSERMRELNYQVEVEGLSFRAAARGFLDAEGLLGGALLGADAPGEARRGRLGTTLALAWEHVQLTALAVLLAAAFAIPLGVLMARHRWLERLSLGAAAVVQTIPSLALLAFLIAVPWLGLSLRSAIAALFLYAVLPILRNTHAGLRQVDPDLIEAARGMGLTERQILVRIRLPLATRTIMAGLRTATVITIGVATLAAFIGAGGLGEPIVTGLYLNDARLILWGAVPAALLALAADALLAALERRLTPRGLRRSE